jgi:kynurenine formamidase
LPDQVTVNWGRWGPDDQRGALNLVDEVAVHRGIGTVQRGRSISLGLPMRTGEGPIAGTRAPMQHFMSRDGGDYAAGLPERPGYGFADDSIIVACHGTSHIDALSHVWRDGQMWNGYPASSVTSRGAARCGIETVGPIVTRALFLDLAAEGPLGESEPVRADRLDDAVRRRKLQPAAGDAILLRTGWLARWRDGDANSSIWPGLDADCAEWLDAHDIAAVGADNIAVEVGPSTVEGMAMPLHVAAIRDQGVFFLELLDLEELALSGATECLLIVAPLNIVGGVGSPVAPVAVI